VIDQCAEMLKKGQLVVFPTETVYGLGASAFDEDAVQAVFKAKGRPADNPLIVHISDMKMLKAVVQDIPKTAHKLMKTFWPGPLSIVLKKKYIVADSVTCGLDTVAVRMPSHPVAHELIKRTGVPIAAPSANTSGKPSGTLATHTIEDLKGKVAAIIDSGKCAYGLESTVIDLSDKPILLRPGAVTLEQLEATIGNIEVADPNAKKPRCPGMKYRHYAPKTRFVFVVGKDNVEIKVKMEKKCKELLKQDKKIIIICSKELSDELDLSTEIYVVGKKNDHLLLGANIFKVLRDLDKKEYDCILMGSCPEEGIGRAINNRVRKAASDII